MSLYQKIIYVILEFLLKHHVYLNCGLQWLLLNLNIYVLITVQLLLLYFILHFDSIQEHQKLLTARSGHGDLSAHFFCLMFSSGLGQRGEEAEGLQVDIFTPLI